MFYVFSSIFFRAFAGIWIYVLDCEPHLICRNAFTHGESNKSACTYVNNKYSYAYICKCRYITKENSARVIQNLW